MNLLTRLRDQTRPHHDVLERQFGLFERPWSVDRYRNLLRRFLGYYEPLEKQIETAADWSAMGFDWPGRRKTLLLKRDLLLLGDSAEMLARLPRCDHLPGVGDGAQALGCMYVLEGATLGGRVVSQHLAAVPALASAAAFSFFFSYGEETIPMWQTFRDFLNAQASGDDDAIVDAACETFTTLGLWLRQ